MAHQAALNNNLQPGAWMPRGISQMAMIMYDTSVLAIHVDYIYRVVIIAEVATVILADTYYQYT